jgi:tryptophan-rich sensory protein
LSESLIGALALCIASAVAEAAFAGTGVKRRFEALRQPRHSPPLWTWRLIGLLYYAVCLVVLKALLEQTDRGMLWYLTFSSVLTMMMANAFWNFIFFRRRNLRASFLFLLAYRGLALGVLVLLAVRDPRVAVVFLGYVVYVVYAATWVYQLWQTNRRGGEAGEQGVEADEAR